MIHACSPYRLSTLLTRSMSSLVPSALSPPLPRIYLPPLLRLPSPGSLVRGVRADPVFHSRRETDRQPLGGGRGGGPLPQLVPAAVPATRVWWRVPGGVRVREGRIVGGELRALFPFMCGR